MRLREWLLCTAVMSLALVNVNATPPADIDRLLATVEPLGPSAIVRRNPASTSVSVPLPRPPSPLIEADKVLGEAYYDTLAILSEDNSCSDFFGGTTGAVMVFNDLMSQVRKEFVAPTIAMRMSGAVTHGTNLGTNTKYRRFAKAAINSNGPFYRRKVSQADTSVPRLGGFEPNTKEIRVLILLHELGHLMKGDKGDWLLPDDGKAEAVSSENSYKIEEVCGEQIKSLTRSNRK